MMRGWRTGLCFAAWLVAAGPAGAQTQGEIARPIPDPKSVPEKVGPPLGSKNEPDTTGSLSDRLDRSGGVIKPGDPDPHMKVAPPSGDGRTPVIRPPGGHEGDVEPK